MMRRLLLTSAVALSLMGLYGIYTLTTQPLLVLPTLSVTPTEGPVNAHPRPVENVRVAQTYLPQQEWAANAQYHIQLKTSSGFIFTNEWQLQGAEKRIRMRPFAAVWMQKNSKSDAEEAITIVSESAVVKFAGSLEMPSPDPGRLVHATLEGRAQVTGPQGLLIDGKNLYFSEAARSLYTDNPVRYEYAGNRGNADKLSIDLIPQEGEPGDERPHIFGLRNVRLSQNVVMELQLKDGQDAFPLKVKCDGSFDFDLLQQRASYTDNVVAMRKTGPTTFDWIECQRLVLQFEAPADGRPSRPLPTPGQPDQYQELDPRLKFRWLQADAAAPGPPHEGRLAQVKLFSNERQLEARATSLTYNGQNRQIRLTDPEGVQILQSRNPMLNCPEVMIALDAANGLQSALCRGPGWMVHRDAKTKSVVFAADWKTHLTYAPDPATGWNVVELRDTASFRHPAQESALGAELIHVWVKPKPGPSPAARSDMDLSQDLNGYEVQRMEAHQDVVFVSPKLEANGRSLEIWIDPQVSAAAPIVKPASRTPTAESGEGTPEVAPESPLGTEPLSATAEKIQVRLRPAANQRPPEPADVWAQGRVVIKRAGPSEVHPLSIQAERAHVENRGGQQQIVHLFGPPAHVRDKDLHLQGQAMHLDRAENDFHVDGEGAFEFLVANDLDGKPLEVPSPLTISWNERMSFDGQVATFHGRATAVLGDRRLSCETMTVSFDERVLFDSPPPRNRKLNIQEIHCQDRVQLRSQTYKLRKLVEIQTAEAWELRMNRRTGWMFAQGPGVMQMWQRGDKSRNGLVAQQTANANAPIQTDTSEWQYTWVKFDGTMEGRMEQNSAVFKQRVELVHGPVKLPNQVFTADNLPVNGGFMSCDELQVKQVRGDDGQESLIQWAGDGNVRLEGRGKGTQAFAASADQVIYDEVRSSYILRAKGRNKVRFWNDVQPGAVREPTAFQRGEFFPETRELRIDGAVGAQGMQ